MARSSIDNKLCELDRKLSYLSINTVQHKKSTFKKAEIIKPVRLRYSSLREYADIFCPLVTLESEYEKKMAEALEKECIEMRWCRVSRNEILVYFSQSEIKETDMELELGQRYRLISVDSELSGRPITGELIHIPEDDDDDYCLQIRGAVKIPQKCNKFSIKALWSDTPFKRMHDALTRIGLGFTSSYLSDFLCGKLESKSTHFTGNLPTTYTVPSVDQLNNTQKRAIQLGLENVICLIQGPPGTGKTITSTCLIYHLNRVTGRKVIALAPSNTAVDNLCARVAKTGLNVVRLYSLAKEKQSTRLNELSVHVKALQLNPGLARLQRKNDRDELKSHKEKNRFHTLKVQAEIRVLQEADVICCTCVMAGDSRMESVNFTNVLIDECGQALEPECLIPISRDVSRLILVGDQCQLSPVVQCPEAVSAGLDRSLFERLHMLGAPFVRLETQYRMHPELSRFPSRVFYDNQIQNGVQASERTGCCRSFWPDPNKPTFFYLVSSEEERARCGVSYLNRKEADVVRGMIQRLIEHGVRRNTIGVIATYAGQKTYLTRELRELVKGTEEGVEVSSVDGYQGREKDYVILSCVRSNHRRTVGFLKDPRRLNVALTRARYGLIIIGDADTLSEDPLWNDLLHFYHEQDLLVEGSLKQLRRATLKSLKPNKPYTYKSGTDWPV